MIINNLYSFAKSVKYILTSSWTKIKGDNKLYPTVIQMPITYNCNSKCVMCNIWQMDHSNEMTVDEFAKFMKDPIFKKVESVGINGGEPSLVKELPKFTEAILSLPKIKSLNIISHGFNQKLLLPALEKMYGLCKEKNVKFHVAISLDGYGETHNNVRGLNVFKIVDGTIKEILKNKNKYCDSFDIGCTIIKQNIDHLIELDVYAKQNNYPIKYRLGIENKRIESDKLYAQYSLLQDHHLKQKAREFFYAQYQKANNLFEKFKYFSIFYFLQKKPTKRLLGCYWKDRGITMDSRGALYYCAVESEKIGSLREHNGEQIFFDKKNIEYRQSIVKNKCDSCIHDYHGKVETANIWTFIKYYLSEKFYPYLYRYKAAFL